MLASVVRTEHSPRARSFFLQIAPVVPPPSPHSIMTTVLGLMGHSSAGSYSDPSISGDAGSVRAIDHRPLRCSSPHPPRPDEDKPLLQELGIDFSDIMQARCWRHCMVCLCVCSDGFFRKHRRCFTRVLFWMLPPSGAATLLVRLRRNYALHFSCQVQLCS